MIIGTYRDDCDSGLYDFPVDDLQQLWPVFMMLGLTIIKSVEFTIMKR